MLCERNIGRIEHMKISTSRTLIQAEGWRKFEQTTNQMILICALTFTITFIGAAGNFIILNSGGEH